MGDSGEHRQHRRRGVIIVNERAPGARRARWSEELAGELGDLELDEVRVNGFPGARAAARRAAADGAELVIAVGGDGTVNACANGIGDRPTRLAVMPAGTANDLARILGQRGDVPADVASIASWRRRDLDALRAGDHRFYSAGGLGWVAEVADTANRWRSGGRLRRWLLARLGSFIYTLACMVVLATGRRLSRRYQLAWTDADGERHEQSFDGHGILVANCNQLGASFHLVPESRVNDGVFELIVFPAMPRRRLLRAVMAARRGRLFDVPGMSWMTATSATVTCDQSTAFFGDGEVLDHGDRFELGIDDAPLGLLAPVAADAVPLLAPAAQQA